MLRIQPKRSGNHEYGKMTADNERELRDAARRLRAEYKEAQGHNPAHCDLTPNQTRRAVSRLGATLSWLIVYACVILAGMTIGQAMFGQ